MNGFQSYFEPFHVCVWYEYSRMSMTRMRSMVGTMIVPLGFAQAFKLNADGDSLLFGFPIFLYTSSWHYTDNTLNKKMSKL